MGTLLEVISDLAKAPITRDILEVRMSYSFYHINPLLGKSSYFIC